MAKKTKKTVGRPSFASSKREQYRQYMKYKAAYRRKAAVYGKNMTDMYTYEDYKAVRLENIKTAKRLDERTADNKVLVAQQNLTSYAQGKAVVSNWRKNVGEIMAKQDRGERLTKVEEEVLKLSTDEKGRFRDTTIKEYRSGEGTVREIWDYLNKLKDQGIDVSAIEEEVAGSP